MLSMSWHKTQLFKTVYTKIPARKNCARVPLLASAINRFLEQQNLGKTIILWNLICRYPCIEVFL